MTLTVTAIVIAFLGIAGTLAATVLAGRNQVKTAEAAARAEDARRMGDRRVAAFAAFASHVIDYRRAELHRWHEVNNSRLSGSPIDAELAPSAGEARSARSAAWGELYLVRLLWDEPTVPEGAEQLLRAASGIEHAPDKNAAKALADKVRADLGQLADSARQRASL